MNQRELITLIANARTELTEKIVTNLDQLDDQLYHSFGHEQLTTTITTALNAVLQDLVDDSEDNFAHYWHNVVLVRVQQGIPAEDMLAKLRAIETTIGWFVERHCGDDHALHSWWMSRMYALMNAGRDTIVQEYITAREDIIRSQAAQIQELSTPIIPLHSGVLVVPLVGMIDSNRAGQILETMLSGISEQQAEVVIIDITGVPVVDTSVAHHLLQAARAARLLGAQVLLVGISAEIAQTLTQLGTDLKGIITRANLQGGIEYALSLMDLEIAPVQRTARVLG